jgi:glycosyl transferase family 25
MEYIENVIYINLDKRTDRLTTIQKELLRVFPYDIITRFSAIYHTTGYVGCTMSHIGALQFAKLNNWKNVLIVEDDMEWCNFETKNLKILDSLIKNPYDVIMLGGSFIDYNKYTYKLSSAATAHCYLVSNHYYDKLIENLNTSLEKLLKSGNPSKYANDQYWKSLQTSDNWYIIVPCIATQSAGFSDNINQFCDIKGYIGTISNDSPIPPSNKIIEVRSLHKSTKTEVVEIKKQPIITLETIEKVVYINLAHRTDRKEEVEAELLKVFPSEKIVRFDAIKHEKGGIGCTLSHAAVLEMAIENNWKNVLIVEDDLQWTSFEKGVEILEKLVKNTFDVILLSGHGVSYNKQTYKLNIAYAQTAILVNNHYFQTLMNNYKEGVEILKTNYNNGNYRGDRYWNRLQKRDNWYIVMPQMCMQRPSFSDIERRHVDYTNHILPRKHGFANNIRFIPK